jgi:hypothetical protein
MRIVIIEAGPTYTERVGTFTANLTGIKSEMVEQAKTLVTKRGYRVMPGPEAAESEGGCCEHVSASDGTEYIAITVYPGQDGKKGRTTFSNNVLKKTTDEHGETPCITLSIMPDG